MKKEFYLYIPLFLFFLSGCRNEPKTEAETQYDIYYDSIMVIHDRTMPLMSKLDNLREHLKQERKKAINEDAKEYLKINNLLSELNRAEDAMFDWMHGFNPDSLPADQKNAYIQLELSKVGHMEGLMLGSIGMAEAHFEEKQNN